MTSSKGKARERQLARAKYERQLARRATGARRRRQLKAGIGVLVLVLAGFGVAWFMGAFEGDKKDSDGTDGKPKDEPSASASQSGSENPSKSGDASDKPSDKASDDASASNDEK